MLDLSFVLQYCVSFLVLQSLLEKRGISPYFCCVLNVMSLISLFDPSLWCNALCLKYVIVSFPGQTHLFFWGGGYIGFCK